MKNLDEVNAEWAKDAIIKKDEPADELVNIPKLHAKYLKAWSDFRMKTQKAHYDYKDLRKKKWLYYTGKLNGTDELTALGWEPFPLTILRQDLGDYLDADADLSRAKIKVQYNEDIASVIEKILKELNQRTWQVRSIIDWHKYTHGIG